MSDTSDTSDTGDTGDTNNTNNTNNATPTKHPPMLTTYSMWSSFRMCRRQSYWRYVRRLVPTTDVARPLYFGKLIHSCLEEWYRPLGAAEDSVDCPEPIDRVYKIIDQNLPQHPHGSSQHATWHLARAIMRGYAATYPEEPWRVLAIEHQFDAPIINPATGATSRSFFMGGRIDGLVAKVVSGLGDAECNFLLEHKTASVIDASYLDKLWTDFQTALYALEIERTLHIKVTGVTYNIITKAKLTQHEGETEAEFAEKYAAACAKNKSGKSSLTRKMPETDEEFAARLDEWYASTDTPRFHREELIISRDQLRMIEEEIWELTQQFLDCRRRDTWYENPQACFLPGRTCPYYPICSSNNNPNVIGNLYEEKAPHEELDVSATASSTAPNPPTMSTAPTATASDPGDIFEPGWNPSTLIIE